MSLISIPVGGERFSHSLKFPALMLGPSSFFDTLWRLIPRGQGERVVKVTTHHLTEVLLP